METWDPSVLQKERTELSQHPSPCNPIGGVCAEVGLPWAVSSCPLQGLESTVKVLLLRWNSCCHVKAHPGESWEWLRC